MVPEVAERKTANNYGLQVSRRYLSARMATPGALQALSADLAGTQPLPQAFRGSAFPFRDTKVATPRYGTGTWTVNRGAAIRDAFMSTMVEIAEERMERISKDPALQGSHQWRKARSTSPTPHARGTPGARTGAGGESPGPEGGFGALANKVGLPRSASGLRMSWALRGPHGAAAPRNFENFRSRNGIGAATGALVTPAGKSGAEAGAVGASASRDSEGSGSATQEETIGGGTTTEGTAQEADETSRAGPGAGTEGQAEAGHGPRQQAVEPLPLSGFANRDARDAYALTRYSCRHLSLVDSPRADAQARAHHQLAAALQYKPEAGDEGRPL